MYKVPPPSRRGAGTVRREQGADGDREDQRSAGSHRSWRTRGAKPAASSRRRTEGKRVNPRRGGRAATAEEVRRPQGRRAGRAPGGDANRPGGFRSRWTSCARGWSSSRSPWTGALEELFASLRRRELAPRHRRTGGPRGIRVRQPAPRGGSARASSPGGSADRRGKAVRAPRSRVTALAGGGRETGTGLIVETADGSRRFRATLHELTALLLEEHREELVTALFGKDVQT